MADVDLYSGGTSVVNYVHCEGTPILYGPPFALPNDGPFFGFPGEQELGGGDGIPPFNAHMDAAYAGGHIQAGYPIKFFKFPRQRNNYLHAKPQIGDTLRLLIIPGDHLTDFVRFDVVGYDPKLAGAQVSLTAQSVMFNTATKMFEWQEISDVADAAAAQIPPGGSTAIALDTPSSTMVSLQKLVGGYVMPLYTAPFFAPLETGGPLVRFTTSIALGLKIESFPTTGDATLVEAQNAWYFTALVRAFECPAGAF